MGALLYRTCVIPLLLVLSCGSLAAQWKKMPSPGLESLDVVFFVDDMLGFVGGFGAVSKTTDGGETWKKVVLPRKSNFIYGIVFPTREVGYVGGAGGLFKTTDGGDSWLVVDSNMYAFAIFFISTDTGFAVDRRDNPRLRMTVDGGKTWTTKREYVANGPDPYRPIVFPSRMVGYLSEESKPGITRTTDGGNTWNYIATKEYLSRLSFPTEKVGYGVKNPNGGGGSDDVAKLYKTTDGGDTWNQLPSSWSQALKTNARTDGINAITFLSETHGYMVGRNPGFGDQNYGRTFILRTTDGGNTWIPFLHEGRMNFPIQEIHAMHFPSSLGYIVGSVKECWKLPCVLSDMQIMTSGPASFKEGDSVVLTLPEALRYKWSTGDTTQSIVARRKGQYIGDIVLADRCVGVDTVSIWVEPQVVLHGYAAPACDGFDGCTRIAINEAADRVFSGGQCGGEISVRACKENLTSLWTATYGGVKEPVVEDIAGDSKGNVYVVARYRNISISLLKFRNDGAFDWIKTFNSIAMETTGAVAVDGDDNVVFVYPVWDESLQSMTNVVLKLTPSGEQIWRRIHGGGNGATAGPADVVIGSANEVYAGLSIVSGTPGNTSLNFGVVKFSADGTERMAAQYDHGNKGYDIAKAFAIDGYGNTYVAGLSEQGNLMAVVLVKFDPSGALAWTYSEAPKDVRFLDLGTDEAGNVYLARSIFTYEPNNVESQTLIKFDYSGKVLWKRMRATDSNDYQNITGLNAITGMDVDRWGNVYLSGSHSNGFQTERFDSAGHKRWEIVTRNPNTTKHTPYQVRVDSKGAVFVGTSGERSLDRTCIIARYEQVGSLSAVDGGDERGDVASAKGALQVTPNPLEATSRISYRVENAADVTLTLHTHLGETVATLVNAYQEPGIYTLTLSPADRMLSAGMYYLRLSAGDDVSIVRVLR